MKSKTTFMFFLFLGLINVSFAESALALSNGKESCSPNDIFLVLLHGLQKDSSQLPKSDLIFGEVQDNKIRRIIDNEFPLAANKVSTGNLDRIKSTFIEANYDGFFMTYLIGHDALNKSKWWGKLYSVTFSLILKHQKVSEQETNIFLKLKDLYGDYTTKQTFRYSTGEQEPGVNVYIWEKPNIVIKYKSPYSPTDNESAIVLEYIDRDYLKDK